MSVVAVAGIFLIVMPLAFNAAFALLAAQFDYPGVLRRPTAEVLGRFEAGGTSLVVLWWCFALTAVLFAPLVVLLSAALGDADGTLLAMTTTVGILAAVVQFLGLIRWPFLVPYLARTAGDPSATAAEREAVDVVFQAFNRYLGVAVGEHLGYAFTGVWSVLVGVAATQSSEVPSLLGFIGIIIGAALMLCSLEFVGAHERDGWKPAGQLTPIAYIAWSLWLIATGVALLA
jgi:Domain of unknown function (DUF4386)